MEIKVDGRLLVSTLCERFKEEFGGTLRVYQGNKRCTGAEKVADLATETGSADDWVLALDQMTLGKLPEIPKQATKADMEGLKAKYGK